tara:strand:+ start:904 stop:1209 length:306 start_codon:yes stop_codon:yes gene_type:complete
MPGKHTFKKHCFKMKTKTGLYKLDKKKNGNSSAPFDKHCFKKAHEEISPLKTGHNMFWRGMRKLDKKTEELKDRYRNSNIGEKIRKGEEKFTGKIRKALGG